MIVLIRTNYSLLILHYINMTNIISKKRRSDRMESVTMEQLLKAEEEKIRGEIRADTTVDQDRTQSVNRLRETLAQALLRYNAANAGNQACQAVADSITAAIQDSFGFLLARTAEKEISKWEDGNSLLA